MTEKRCASLKWAVSGC